MKFWELMRALMLGTKTVLAFQLQFKPARLEDHLFEKKPTRDSRNGSDENFQTQGRCFGLQNSPELGIPRISTENPEAVEKYGPSDFRTQRSLENCNIAPTVRQTVPNIFQPVQNSILKFPTTARHPRSPKGTGDSQHPIHTNKFYTNLLLGDQNLPIYTIPYALSWTGCDSLNRNTCHGGVGIWHTDEDDLVFGPGTPAEYFYNPSHLQDVVLTAKELDYGESYLSTRNLSASAATIVLSSQRDSEKTIMELPIVQGMGFVTAIYHNATPIISSFVGIREMVHKGRKMKEGTNKFLLRLSDGSSWVVYILSNDPAKPFNFVSIDGTADFRMEAPFSGILQIAKIPPNTDSVSVYDKSYGVYATGFVLSGSVEDGKGTYTITWHVSGFRSKELLIFALPHQVESMSPDSRLRLVEELKLRSQTKGPATAMLGNRMTLIEADLPFDIDFLPWPQPTDGKLVKCFCAANSTLRRLINIIALYEIEYDITERIEREDSVYQAGKIIANYARVVHTAFSTKNRDTAEIGLSKLKKTLSKWARNAQKRPLWYESIWGGIVTSWAFDNRDSRVDFGAVLYNDHHFHYGYWIYTAAVIADIDKNWISSVEGSEAKHWVSALIRDFANPVEDESFPFSRTFDWYHGHSWATGLELSVDGKNEESTSEDAFALYAVKLWGLVVNDAAMRARSDLQLAILKRSLKNYFLMTSNNKNQPTRFVGNNAPGIVYENKIHHTTFFGSNPEYVHGIHMLPICPISGYMRSVEFIVEEWKSHFAKTWDTTKDASWRSLLKANQALIDPLSSYEYFSSSKFDMNWIGQGESRAYYVFYSSILAGLL